MVFEEMEVEKYKLNLYTGIKTKGVEEGLKHKGTFL